MCFCADSNEGRNLKIIIHCRLNFRLRSVARAVLFCQHRCDLCRMEQDDLPKLAEACRGFVDLRWPAGGGGGAAMLFGDGTTLCGTSPDVLNASVEMCHEVEPFAAAFRLQQPVVASTCLHKESAGRFLVFSPCGVCRERLAIHGPQVHVAVASPDDVTVPVWKTLGELLPDYWLCAVPGELPSGWGDKPRS